MVDGVVVRYRWTLSEVMEATRWHLRQSLPRRIIFFGCLILAVLCACSATQIYLHTGRMNHNWGGTAGAIYFLLLAALLLLAPRWRLRRLFARNSARDAEIAWQITAVGLQMSYIHGSSDMKWQAFNKAVLTPTGLLLYSQPAIFHWLPRHGFESGEGYEAVTAWAREHIPAFRVMH